jgi:Methane oxygenase PmoA
MKLRTASVLLILTAPLSAQVEFQAHEDRLSVLIAGKPFAGESTDHPHHRGLSFSHADVNGFNFWASDPSRHDAKTGAIRLNRIARLVGGADSGSAEVVFDWIDPRGKANYAGEVDGEELGIAIFDDPGNPRHPTWWHARGYGLFAANPFGVDFSGDKSASGAIALESGHTVRFRYRVLIHPGRTDPAKLTQAYASYVKGGR